MTPSGCLTEIRAYTARHAALQRAHHFLFDLRVGDVSRPVDAVVMGLNPGEDSSDWDRHPITDEMRDRGCIHEESSEVDFMFPRVRKWTRDIVDTCGTSNVTQSEGFFWSSKKGGREFKDRFGWLPRDSPHLPFCNEMNRALLDYFQPAVVIIVGWEFLPMAKQLFQLKGAGDHVGRLTKPGNLIEHYEGSGRHWIATLHWRAFGFSGDERAIVRRHIRQAIPQRPAL